MVTVIQQKQPHLPISILQTDTYKHGGCMITIGKIPKKLQSFFKPLKRQVSEHVHSYFWSLVLSICISHGSTIDQLVKLLRNTTHRTNHGEFLWRSNWDESSVMQQIALDTLRRLFNKKDRQLFFIIDDTQTLKRAKKMEAVGKLHHHATGKYGTGHTILKVCLYYRGITIPWASLLYIKQEHARGLKVPFRKLTELAGQAIREAALPEKFKVTVLFDAFYLCPNVVNACKKRKWHYIGVGKSNRWFTVGSVKRKLAQYGKNVLRNSGLWCNITGLRKTKAYRLTERIGKLNKLGTVKIVFSRRKGENKQIALVTDDLRASMKTIVANYLKRWSIEMLIKDEKQQLGLGDYRVKRYRAVVRHLHLVDCAYACLTHAGIKACRAQGQNKSKNVLRLEPISKLKDRMRRIVWQENVQDVIKYSHEKPVIRRLEKLLAA
ncbi:MAG: transposase [Planctomycetes bacterium]|nr:transposase [Planctomycetota bacterium]